MASLLNLGIVGFGGMGRGHSRNVAQIEGMTLAAVSDPKPEARRAAEDLGATAFADHAEMLDSTQLDALIVACPSNLHGKVVKDSCSRGVHVFCEKPLTTSLSEALEVRDAVKESGVVFSIGLVLRHSEVYQRARAMIEGGEIGSVLMADCRYGGYMLGRYEYVFSLELGRGLINEHTIHMIDVMDYLLGPVDSVYAATDASDDHTEYNVAAVMGYQGGAFTTISGSGVSRIPGHARITGMEGELLIEGNSRLLLKDENGEREVLSAGLGYREELEDFADAIRRGSRPHTGIDEALACSRLIEAVYRSAQSGAPVNPQGLSR
jgi:predicted dehydrogenase